MAKILHASDLIAESLYIDIDIDDYGDIHIAFDQSAHRIALSPIEAVRFLAQLECVVQRYKSSMCNA